MEGLTIRGFDTSSFDGDVDVQSFNGSSILSEVVATPVNDSAVVSAKLNNEDIDLSSDVDIPVGSSTLTINVTEQ